MRELVPSPCLRICFMPELLPDELLYSLIGRIGTENALGTPKACAELLFGTKHVIPGVDLPTLLDSLQRRLGSYSPWSSPTDLIDNATLYPYHRPFLTFERHGIVEKILLSGGGKALKTVMGRVANRFGAAACLRYCPACNETDIALYGVPYWHRAHQLPGVTSCYLHGLELLNYFAASLGTDKQRLILAPAGSVLGSRTCESDPHQIAFAALSNELLTARLPALEAEVRQRVYRDAVVALGLNRNGRVDHQALAVAVRQHYCDFVGFAHRERLLATRLSPFCWMRDLVDRPDRSSHPICHLVLIGFLFKTVAKFSQAVANELALGLTSDTKAKNDSGNPAPALPTTAHEQLLRNTRLSCREAARALALSVTTIIKQRRVLGVPISDRPKYLARDRLAPVVLDLKNGVSPQQIANARAVSLSTIYRLRSQFSELIHANASKKRENELVRRRKHWLQVVETHRDDSLKAARAAAASTYAWLYRHDRAWLQGKSKQLQSQRVRLPRVDWPARDMHLCEVVSSYVNGVMSQKERPRISRTLMTRHVGDALIRSNIRRLPRLQSLLQRLEETPIAYQLYRIDRAIVWLVKNSQPVINWRIKRTAGIRRWTGMHNAYANWKAKNFVLGSNQ